MKLIIGLGNIGSRYATTRHNIGFMVVDSIAAANAAKWKFDPKLKSEIATYDDENEKMILAKPQTMMNLSGEAAQRLIQEFKLKPNDVWVVFDDVDTPFGRLRTRLGGSAGGHNGVKSIVEHVGEGFWRYKVGISLNDRDVESSEVYVLKPFNNVEQLALPNLLGNVTSHISRDMSAGPTEQSISLI